MKQESIDKLKQAMVSTYQRYGGETACFVKGSKSYTGHEIADAIENETDFGLTFMESIMKLTVDLIKRDKINIGCEDIDKRYDPEVDRYLTFNQYVGELAGSGLGDWSLKQMWLNLPLTKPDKDTLLLDGVLFKVNDVIQLADPLSFKKHLINERMLENEIKNQMELDAGHELPLVLFMSKGLYTHKLMKFMDFEEYTFRIIGFKDDSIQVSIISNYDDVDVRKYFNKFDFKNAKIFKMGYNNFEG